MDLALENKFQETSNLLAFLPEKCLLTICLVREVSRG